ncbi:MAG TPA: TolC family protein, partial [Candidatus Caenarcaniphilales bacterium]
QRRRIALAQLGPQLGIFTSYDVQNRLGDNQGFFDNYSLGASVRLNLFDGGAARAQAAQESTNIAIAETRFADVRNQVRFQVEQAYFNLQSSFENTRTASVAVDQARESLRLSRLRFQAGVGTQTDVIAAETDLTQAQGNLLQAILGYNRALSSLQRQVSNLQAPAP